MTRSTRAPWCFLLVVTLPLVTVLACGGGGGGGDEAETWHSALFPPEAPVDFEDAAGRYLPDVSWAGYHNGELPLPALEGRTPIDVVADHDADPTGGLDATIAFQAALDEAGPTTVVHVPAGLYRVDGLLEATRPGTVIRGVGAERSRVYFTRHASMTGRSHLTFRGGLQRGAETPLAVDADARDTDLWVDDASGFAVGDDVLVGQRISDAFVAEHGMTGTWQAFHDTWQAFLRREIVELDTSATPHRVVLDVPVRYPLRVRDAASLRLETGHLEEVGIADLGLANAVAWDDAWSNERVHVLAFVGVKDAWARGVRSFASPGAPVSGPGAGAHLQSGGIHVQTSKRVTLAECRMERAEHRGGGGCGYLFEILQACEVLTRDCVAVAGRHNFIQNWGFGTTGCVWLRCASSEGFAISTPALPSIGQLGFSEYHHSLATANLVDSCVVGDGWAAANRGDWSSGAGHTATRCVFWNMRGNGILRSRQFGWGYVVGTSPDLVVETDPGGSGGAGSAPEDWREGIGRAGTLKPASLYAACVVRRIGRASETAP